ncbi:MAG: hypothetical protein ACFCVC_12200 [Acidimicrobiia bacterium]
MATAADPRPDPAPGPALTRDPDDDYVIHLARAHDVASSAVMPTFSSGTSRIPR